MLPDPGAVAERVARRAIALAADTDVAHAPKRRWLRWMALDDDGCLDAAMRLVLVSDASFITRQRAIHLLACARYIAPDDTVNAQSETS